MMLPKEHVLWGAVFSIFLWLFVPWISLSSLTAVFLASFLIDIDHYISAVIRTKSLHPGKAVDWQLREGTRRLKNRQKGIMEQEPFHLFHTLEFHVLIAGIGFFIPLFFYIFLGMVFHSLLDIYTMLRLDNLDSREFFFFKWLAARVASLDD